MKARRKYQKRTSSVVVAVQLDLDTEGFTYQKWGDVQTCKPGDWLVNNAGEVYTIDGETFARTYRSVSRGIYVKDAPVWAEIAEQAGKIETKEGVTHYEAGDYIVYNEAEGGDGYAMTPDAFGRMYEPAS